MADFTSTKPYMVRAIHEWCMDNGCTPHLLVAVDSHARVPVAYVKNGEIVLNVNYSATKDLLIGNEAISFSARFGGVSQNLYVPMHAVKGIFARENGQGMFFEIEDASVFSSKNEASDGQVEASDEKSVNKSKKPTLTIVK
ncbi:MAG: ClpXP protease specificity-enhancing factor [Methylotenera sp.]|uniref:ClpXP protease specificity-enhancing factor n=1 Tax=Methylotenera sp. TaxID=2051956 RepID=UPI0024893B2D|nr:ClpXP protease specificity-enhancing factor [Methylotenera sp.]MDI1309137.1 ClpXP protease specificity-enhancing factor [Methylotenera sp.]